MAESDTLRLLRLSSQVKLRLCGTWRYHHGEQESNRAKAFEGELIELLDRYPIKFHKGYPEDNG